MRMRSIPALALLALVAAAALVATSGGARTKAPTSSASWIGLAGAPRPRVALGQRMIVVLRSPSLGDRVARAGGFATEKQERSWTAAALASQNVLISRLAVQGVRIRTEFRYARVLNGFSAALAAPKPDDQDQVEEHGTEMAGLLVGGGGPYGLAGVATGASVLPIRVAGWQQDATGGWSVYARSDQIVAGLESAVDPNGDDDAHDAARIALVALAEPYAAFADDPVALAAGGALHLDTLVVVPAGNDGPAGPQFGFVSGPGGGPAALTVGAADMRAEVESARVVVRVGLHVVLDRVEPVAGSAGPSRPVSLTVAAPRSTPFGDQPEADGAALARVFDPGGLSRVAGRAALVDAGDAPRSAVEDAARAGATAVLVHGGLPSGSLGLDEGAPIPVVDLPAATAGAVLVGLAS